jgi:hypothetical protein
MFQVIERSFELIFCNQGIKKSDFGEVAEVMFREGEWI